jgi:hypothetical protein
LIHVKYVDELIELTCDTIDDNNVVISTLQVLKTLEYESAGIWSVNTDEVEELSSLLFSIKDKCIIDKSLIEWRKAHPIQKSPLLIRCGVVYSKIYKSDYDIPHKAIEDATKYFWKPAVNNPKFKAGKWDGYINLYKRWEHSFPSGLLSAVEDVLKQNNIQYRIEYGYDRQPKAQFDWSINDGITPDPDQIEAIDACLKGLRGICKAPTGFGKTAILAKRLTAAHGVPTLFIANKKTLLDDASKEFKDMVGVSPEDVIQIKDGWFGKTKLTAATTVKDVKPLTEPIMVATVQSLHARLQDARTKDYLLEWLHNRCKFVMVDETQAVGTKIWDEVLDECYAPYRVFKCYPKTY